MTGFGYPGEKLVQKIIGLFVRHEFCLYCGRKRHKKYLKRLGVASYACIDASGCRTPIKETKPMICKKCGKSPCACQHYVSPFDEGGVPTKPSTSSRRSEDDSGVGDFLISAGVAAATDSALLGIALGGDAMGAIAGDLFDGDLFD